MAFLFYHDFFVKKRISHSKNLHIPNICCTFAAQKFWYMIHIDNIVEYLVLLTAAFSRRFAISEGEAYRYLKRYDAIRFAHDYYDVMHTQSFADMVQSIALFCQRKGGTLV